jgi:hypothetical protein
MITEQRVREIIQEELDKRIVCGYTRENWETKAGYFPLGVIMTKSQLKGRKTEKFSETTIHTD